MDNRPFSDKVLKPSKDSLKKVLGKGNDLYDELNNLTLRFKKDWNFSKSSGWMQKVHDGKKALYYFIPLNDSFLISLTLREHEKIDFLSDDDLYDLHDQIKTAKKYSEGYALRFLIDDIASFSKFITLIKKLIEKRSQQPKNKHY
ncbi:DUF3788 family protein [Maribacter sp. 2308TA10-17]|uniref:DUF3788 family protein n=1 Tax=Maribacter sp. 2308TA10-17 TaxID=3386276 RepID=UPI0039BCA218